jgi:tetratricopeptide (TPR) repeat protein
MEYRALLKLLSEVREPVLPYLSDFEEADSSEEVAVKDSLGNLYEISNYCIRGDIFALDRDYNQALASYGRAFEMQPDNPDLITQYRSLQLRANNRLIREFMAKNRGQNELIKRFSEQFLYKPDDAQSQFKIGVAYQKEGWTDAAIAQYKIAMRIAPDNPYIRHNLALLYDQTGQTQPALAELQKAIELDSALVPSYIHLGIIYKREGNPALARKMLSKALALDPGNDVANELFEEMK